MPSKLGFGNSRKKAGKAEYGSSMYYKNPIKKTTDTKEKKTTETLNNAGEVAAKGSMTYPNNPEISALSEKDMEVKAAISKSGDGTETGERKKLILQNYMATGYISDEDNQFLIDNQ